MANLYNISGLQTDKDRPVAPASFAAAGGAAQVVLTWDDTSADYDILHIESSLDEVAWTYIAGVAKDVQTYTHTGLTAATTYYYRARAFKRLKSTTYLTDNDPTNA